MDSTTLAVEASDPVVGTALVDDAGLFVSVDDAAAEMLGEPESNLIGHTSSIPLPEDADEVWTVVPSPGRVLVCHIRRSTKDGSLWRVGLSATAGRSSQDQEILDFAQGAPRIILQQDQDLMAGALVDAFSRASGLTGTILVMMDPETGDPTFAGGRMPRREQLAAMEECRRRGAAMVIWQAFTERKVVIGRDWINLVLTDPRMEPIRPFIEASAEPSDGAFVAVPLWSSGRPVGVVAGMAAEVAAIGPETVLGWIELARHTSLALEYREALGESAAHGAEQERTRLTEELHDSLAQTLFALRLAVAGAEAEATSSHSAGPHAANLGEIRALADLAAAQARNLISERRRSSVLENLRERIANLAAGAAQSSGLQIDVSVSNDWDDLSAEFGESAERMIKEALQNIVKHAQATRAAIRLVRDPANPRLLLIEIVDNGTGFDLDTTTESFGLASIRQRAMEQHGSVEMSTAPSTTLRIRMLPKFTTEWDAAHRQH